MTLDLYNEREGEREMSRENVKFILGQSSAAAAASVVVKCRAIN